MVQWLHWTVCLCLLITLLFKVFSENTTGNKADDKNSEMMDDVVKHVRDTVGYNYLIKLHQTLSEQLRLCDELDDYSCRRWALRAYLPDLVENNTVIFRRSRLKEDTPFFVDSHGFTCVISHVEYLLPVFDRTELSRAQINVFGQHVSHENSGPSGASIFNLTGVQFLKKSSIRITVLSSWLTTHLLRNSVLFTFCNMNATVIDTILGVTVTDDKNVHIHDMQGDDPKTAILGADDKTSDKQKKQSRSSVKQLCPKKQTCNSKSTSGKCRGKSTSVTSPVPKVDFHPQLEGCKRHKLVISLTTFFPPAFQVLQPTFYDVGQCKGICAHVTDYCRLDVFRTGRAFLLNRNVNTSLVNHVSCSPHKMESASFLIYHTKTFKAIIIANTRVKTCRCV
uniref:TGF-beta family profile domain-containing protein n=1 Tax=Biomphalaria glabrata TaxID=6526 RepID=A0A2C9KZB1_BIOGL